VVEAHSIQTDGEPVLTGPQTGTAGDAGAVGATQAGGVELQRLQSQFQPSPPDGIYQVSPSLLDEAEASFQALTGAALPTIQATRDDPFSGLTAHPLGWAVGRLRDRLATADWRCMEDAPTSNAVTLVTGFLHFAATWSGHPLFPAMAATAAGTGFSLHGLAPYAAAHCMIMMGNQITFADPETRLGPIDGFVLAAKGGPVKVHIETFDRFEYPFGQPWDQTALRAAAAGAIEAAQSRINLRNPGSLILSPGTALDRFDWALIQAIKELIPTLGRKNRGLMAVAPVVLRLQAVQDPRAIRFGYGCFPVVNKHYAANK
jgi:hypothetical protein